MGAKGPQVMRAYLRELKRAATVYIAYAIVMVSMTVLFTIPYTLLMLAGSGQTVATITGAVGAVFGLTAGILCQRRLSRMINKNFCLTLPEFSRLVRLDATERRPSRHNHPSHA
jgi:uncharacterized membrane protein YdjX (TVP38/TMEM64 family)